MRLVSVPVAFVAATILSISSLAADTASPAKPKPATCSAPEFRQWDFWLGAWRVTDPKGVFQGTNDIKRALSGCGLVENWRGAGGGQGMSLNGYDAVRKTWTQLWVSPSSVIRLEGKFDEHGVLRTTGTISYNERVIEHPFRGIWTPQNDGSVKQKFYEFNPTTKTWEEWFTGIYRRRKM